MLIKRGNLEEKKSKVADKQRSRSGKFSCSSDPLIRNETANFSRSSKKLRSESVLVENSDVGNRIIDISIHN